MRRGSFKYSLTRNAYHTSGSISSRVFAATFSPLEYVNFGSRRVGFACCPRSSSGTHPFERCEPSECDATRQAAEGKHQASDGSSSQLRICGPPETPIQTGNEQLNESPESAGDDETPKTPSSVGTIVNTYNSILSNASESSPPYMNPLGSSPPPTPGKIQRLSQIFRRVFRRSITP